MLLTKGFPRSCWLVMHHHDGGGSFHGFWTKMHIIPLILMLLCWPSTTESALKIDKNTIELVNNGLKALVSIKQILSTIQALTELSSMLNSGDGVSGGAQPSVQPSNNQVVTSLTSLNNAVSANQEPSMINGNNHGQRPRMSFVQKLFGKLPTILLLPSNKATQKKSPSIQRDPSVGLIKIGEKPPPGLFPETLPYSVSQFDPQQPSLGQPNGPEAIRLATANSLTDYSTKTIPESQLNRFFYLSSPPTTSSYADNFDHPLANFVNPYHLLATSTGDHQQWGQID